VSARAWAALALASAAAGCAGAPVSTHAAVADSLRVSAVVLEPVRGATAEEVAALDSRLVAITLDAVSGEALVFAGAEVKVLHPNRRDWTANAEAQSQQEVRGASGSAVGAAAELHWRATVEVFQPSTGLLLVETTAEAQTDPFARGGTEAATLQPAGVLERAAREALAQLSSAWAAPRPAQGPRLSTWTAVPAPEGRLAHGLEAEVLRLQLLLTANPGLDEEEAARLARLPAGVLVRASDLGFRLRPGDLVLSIDGTLANAAALARVRYATSPTVLEVRSPEGRLRRVNFP